MADKTVADLFMRQIQSIVWVRRSERFAGGRLSGANEKERLELEIALHRAIPEEHLLEGLLITIWDRGRLRLTTRFARIVGKAEPCADPYFHVRAITLPFTPMLPLTKKASISLERESGANLTANWPDIDYHVVKSRYAG